MLPRSWRKVLQSAVANAVNNDGQQADELFVSACYVDEGPTPEALASPGVVAGRRGSGKRSAHVTIIVSRLPEEQPRAAAGSPACRKPGDAVAPCRGHPPGAVPRAPRARAAESGATPRPSRHPRQSGTDASRRNRRLPRTRQLPSDAQLPKTPAGAEDAAHRRGRGRAAEAAEPGQMRRRRRSCATEVAEAEGPEPTDSRGGEQEKDS